MKSGRTFVATDSNHKKTCLRLINTLIKTRIIGNIINIFYVGSHHSCDIIKITLNS